MTHDKEDRDDKRGRATLSRKNQGEGDKESARRYNEQQKAFVRSAEGQQAIEEAGEMSEREARDARDAEAKGRARARGEDPAVAQPPRDRDGRR